jgi:hypothetical protein
VTQFIRKNAAVKVTARVRPATTLWPVVKDTCKESSLRTSNRSWSLKHRLRLMRVDVNTLQNVLTNVYGKL